MKNIVFIAPPAAGKGTQSKKICSFYKVPHISIGDLLRDISTDTEEGKYIAQQMKQGILVKDETIAHLLEERLQKEDCVNGYVLDGFPRNKEQAIIYDKMLSKLGKKVDIALYLEIEYEALKDRIAYRVSCPNCGHVFNTRIDTLKPKKEGLCDHCHHILTKRSDDNEDSFKKRWNTYQTETEPLIDFYKQKNILHPINSMQTADEIFKEILQILEEGAS